MTRYDEWVPAERLVPDNDEGRALRDSLKKKLEDEKKAQLEKERAEAAARAKEKKRLSAPLKPKKVPTTRFHAST